jgi:uncharacterized membrane protein
VLRLVRLLLFLRLAPLVRILFSAEGVRYAALLTLLTALTGGVAFASVEKATRQNVRCGLSRRRSRVRVPSLPLHVAL